MDNPDGIGKSGETMEPKSKSQVKREMSALQALGEQLIELSRQETIKIEMPPELREAVDFAKTLKRGEARRRHLQYIGALMRDADPEPIRKALEEISRGHGGDAQLFRKLERWRDELIEGNNDLVGDILDHHPTAERQKLYQLVLNARKEKETNNPSGASRALFRYLREISKTAPSPSEASSPS